MKNYFVAVALCLVLISLFFGCVQSGLKEDSSFKVTTTEDLSTKLNMPLEESIKPVESSSVNILNNVFKAELKVDASYPSMKNAFEYIGLSIQGLSDVRYLGGLESATYEEYATGYLLEYITIISEFKKTTTPIVKLDNIRPKDSLKHTVKIKNNKNTPENIIIELIYELPDAKEIIWNNEIYYLEESKVLEFTAFEKEIEYSDGFSATYSIPIAEIEAKLEDGSKSIIDFSDIMFEKHRAIVTYDGKKALIKLQVSVFVNSNTEYVIDPYLIYVPSDYTELSNTIQKENIKFLEILDFNKDKKNDLVLSSNNQIYIFYDYLNRKDFENPDEVIVFDGYLNQILSLSTHNTELAVGVFPEGTYFINSEGQKRINKAGANFYGGYIEERLYFSTVPNYAQLGGISYITLDFENYAVLYTDYELRTSSPKITCDKDICCFGISYESKVYCIDKQDLKFDNSLFRYSDIAFVTLTGRSQELGKQVNLIEDSLVISAQNEVYYISNIKNLRGNLEVENYPMTYEKEKYGSSLLEYSNNLFVLSPSGLYKVGPMDQGNIADTNDKYEISNSFQSFVILDNGEYAALDNLDQIYFGAELPEGLFSIMDASSISSCGTYGEGSYILTSDLTVNNNVCLNFEEISSSSFILDCQGHTITAIGDNAEAIRVYFANLLDVKNCNFIIENSNSIGVNTLDVREIISENCAFSVSNGEYSYAIKSNIINPLLNGKITFSDLDIIMSNTIHSNAVQLENMRNSISITEVNIQFDEVVDTAGIAIKNSKDVSLNACDVNSVGESSEQVVGYSLDTITKLNINNINANLLGKGATGIAMYGDSNDILISNSNYYVKGRGVIGVHLTDIYDFEVINIGSNAEGEVSIDDTPSFDPQNNFVKSALLVDIPLKYNWIYALLSKDTDISNIRNSEFYSKCFELTGGSIGGGGGDWSTYNSFAVKLSNTYQTVFESNEVLSEYCVALGSENVYGQIKDNNIVRSLDVYGGEPISSSVSSSATFIGDISMSLRTLTIDSNNFTSSLIGVVFYEGSNYNIFDFRNNRITDCPLNGLENFDSNSIYGFSNNYICNNGFYSYVHYDIYGLYISNFPSLDFDTTTCTDYSFLFGGSGNCLLQCFDCPSIDNFDMTANCPDFDDPNFAGTQSIWGLDIPTVYSDDTICLTAFFTNPYITDLTAYMTCYNLGTTPTRILDPGMALFDPSYIPVPMGGHADFVNVFAGNDLTYDRSISNTFISSCDYYQCFAYWDPQTAPPPPCTNDWEELFFFVENREPTISVAPTITDMGTSLFCDITRTRALFYDPDGDSPGTPIRYTWYVNGVLQTEEIGNTLSDLYYSPGDTIICEVSIPDNSNCPQLYSNILSNSIFIQAVGWIAVDPHPEGYTDTTYYCDFEYQMPLASNYQIEIKWYAFDSWTDDWSTSIPNDPFIIYTNSYTASSTTADEDLRTSLDYSIEKCHYLACEANITALDGDYSGYSLVGNSTMSTTDFPISGQGSPTYIINRPPVLTNIPTLNVLSSFPLIIRCDISRVGFTDLDYNDIQDLSSRRYSWYDAGSLITGQTGFSLVVSSPPSAGTTYTCCVDMFDSIVNGNCQDSARVCNDIIIPPRTLSFDINLSADSISDYLAPPGLRITPSYDDDCEPIKYGDTRVNNCAYEDSNFTCTVHNIIYTGVGAGPTTKDVVIYDNEENMFVVKTGIGYNEIVYYNNEDPGGCLENPNCQKGDILYCNVTLYDAYGPLETFTSNPVQIHNFIPEISKPKVYVITDSFPDSALIGDYTGEYLKANYENQFICVPSDEWQNGYILPDYNNDSWDEISYYWEWSAVDTGYVDTTTDCDYTDYGLKCSNNECFENTIKEYLCALKIEREDEEVCDDPENILCWGPDIDDISHWLPFVPMAQLRNLDGFKYIPNMNVTYGVCDWASLGGLTGCPPSGEFEIECINGGWIGTDTCRTDLYTAEMNILKQCAQGTRQCYELLESCSFDNSYIPPGIVSPTGSCPSTGIVAVAGFDITPEDIDWDDPWGTGSITEWNYDCLGEYLGIYRFWHTSWYLRGPYISFSTPYETESYPCSANDYFGIKTNPDIPSFSMWNTYLSDIHGLFYEKDKPYGIPIRCCINQSDVGFESTYSDMACSDPTCGNYLDCGPCYYDEDGEKVCYSKSNCISNDEEQCYVYLQDSCNEEILWNTNIEACSGVDTSIRCYYNYTYGTAFDVERHIDIITGEITIEQTDNVQQCYPCMQYWPMLGDDDFYATDFNEEWGYYYNPWWLRDLLFNESYVPNSTEDPEEYPIPNKVSLFDDTISYENITIDTAGNIVEPCNPNTDPTCEISLREWWSGPYGAQQNNTFNADSYDSAWAEEYRTKLKTELADEFDIPEENIVGRFFATAFKYCNQWDEEFVKDIIDYEDKESIDSRFSNEWPNVELGISSVDNSEYPFAGREGNDNYLTSGIFSHENGIGSSQYLVWNAQWPDEYAQYNELECDNYEQCRKHARISADYVFGIVYNTTYKHITCECPDDLTTGDCTDNFGDANSVGLPGDRVWQFNRNTCSCVAVCGARPIAPNCEEIEPGTVAHYNDNLCQWECRVPITPRPIIPGVAGGSGYGTGIHWSGIDSEFGEIIEEELTYVLLAEDDYYPEARFGLPGSDSFPTCSIDEIQTEDSNCFVSDEYYNKLYDYSISHDISDLIIGTSSEDISLDCSDLEDYSDYSNVRSFCHYSYSLWDLDSCQTHDEERIGFRFDNNYQNETENEGCGFCQGLLINNTAPSIEYLGIIANDDPSVDPPTNFTCTIDGFNDIDTNPADLIKNATFRWCNNEDCTIEYTRETIDYSEPVLGENANSTYVNSALPTDPITGDPIIYCCAQVYDTDWQSKQSEEYCQAFNAEATEPSSCSIILEGIENMYIWTDILIAEFDLSDDYTFNEIELPYRIADVHLIHEGEDIGTYSCYQTSGGIECFSSTGYPEIVIGELEYGNYQIIANNSEKDCTPDSKSFVIRDSGIPITDCGILEISDAYYYLANDLIVNGNMGSEICTPTLTSTSPNLDRFVSNYPDCLHCCLIVNADNVMINLNGYSIISNVNYNPSSLDRLGGICAKDKTDVEIYNSDTLNGGLFSWDRGITFLKSKNTNINHIEIDSLALAGTSRANEYYMSGISLSGCQNTTVEDNRIARYTSGTEVFYSKDTNIKNNIFSTNSFGVSTSWLGDRAGPLSAYRMPIEGRYCDYIVSDIYIENNKFLDCGTGIKGLKTGNLFAVNNNFTNNRYVGVELRGCGITNIIFNNKFDTITDPSGSAIRTMYLNSGYNFVFANNEIVNSKNGISIQKTSNLQIEISSNQITDCGTGLRLSESNDIDLQLLNNIIEDNQRGVLLNYSLDTFAFDLIPDIDTTGWVEGTARIELCDSNTLIGCYDHYIPVSLDCSNKIDLWTSKECYISSENININVQRVCKAKRNAMGDIEYPISNINLNIINTGSIVFTHNEIITTLFGPYLFSIANPIDNGRYNIEGTVECEYLDSDLDEIYQIVNETFEVSSTCPDNYYHFENNGFNSNPSYCWPIDDTITENWITYHTVSSGIVEFNPRLEIYDSSGALALSSDGTGTCFESDEITLDNNEICDNTIYDINDTLIYCSVPSITETTYTSNTCDDATSYSVDDNLICADICGTGGGGNTCNCIIEIESITWPAHEDLLPDAVCGGEEVRIKVKFENENHCSDLNLEDISISISNTDILSSVISSGNANSIGDYTYLFDRFNTNFGDYRVTATHSECSRTTGEFPFGQCYGEDACQLLNSVCDNTLVCCDPDTETVFGYEFNLVCVGFCCVPEGATCYPDIEERTGTQCCPELSCIGGKCTKDDETTIRNGTEDGDGNDLLLNITNLFNYPNCSFDECNRTSDCCVGYCYRNMCMGAPASMWLFGLYPRPGCEGLPIEPIGILGFIICDLMWLWVLITALIAGYKAKQSYRMPIPIFAFIFPFIVALFLYPYLGVLVGVFEILIFLRKKEEEELEYEEQEARGEFTDGSFGNNSDVE